jgi:large subunit ribosomal protein L9
VNFEDQTMEVILREHVDNLGRRGDVVKVADGYARNFLLPRKLALLATEGNKKQIEREKVKFEAKEAEERSVADAIAARMGALEIEIARRVGETEALYGSVTSADIGSALEARGFEVDRRKIQLQEPIKKLGEFDIPIRLHRDVTTHVKVRVVAEGAHIEKSAKK